MKCQQPGCSDAEEVAILDRERIEEWGFCWRCAENYIYMRRLDHEQERMRRIIGAEKEKAGE